MNTSQPSSLNFCCVAIDECGLALSQWNTTPFLFTSSGRVKRGFATVNGACPCFDYDLFRTFLSLVTHFSSPVINCLRNVSELLRFNKESQMETGCIRFLLVRSCGPQMSSSMSSVTVNAIGSIATRENVIFNILIFSLWCRDKSAALSSATQYAMPLEFGGKWGMENHNISLCLYPATREIQR